MLAGRQAALVIVPPQVAVVGAGWIGLTAVPRDEGVGLNHFLPLSLTFDHRIVSGGEASRFLQALIGDLRGAA
jgi:2-oxoisovalerate dehydrogenase E2 component (dihydrolipoyl transacylase)